ncbi:Bug family tripartite tricarboxylate transporter substrate binding protein [Muricoccus radiodurans]|uniref:Bug family tripartite tricarboxylate transporter substrate binding protein n=1 Tax=Muricoccus radiodurans TaxID=2231721 RepID=UPI003CEA1712
MDRRSLLGATLATGLAGTAAAQDRPWPTRPLRIVVPFGTGGSSDISARVLAAKLTDLLGQSVVIENRAGAGGTAGTDFVAKAAPNGEVFVQSGLTPMALAIGLYRNLPYDPVRDLVGVAPTAFVPLCIAINAQIPARDAAEFIALLRANPGRYFFGSAGVGTSGHICSANFLSRIGATAEHVPFRGGGELYLALQKGDVAFCTDTPSVFESMRAAGSVRIVLVATEERMARLPDVPTAREVGLGEFRAHSWYGIYAPAGTPRPVVTRLAQAIEEALGDPAVAARFEELGTPVMRGWTPERFADYLRDEIAFWVPLVRASGARAD